MVNDTEMTGAKPEMGDCVEKRIRFPDAARRPCVAGFS